MYRILCFFLRVKKKNLPTTGVTNNIPRVHVNKILPLGCPRSLPWPMANPRCLFGDIAGSCLGKPGGKHSRVLGFHDVSRITFHQQVCHTVDGWNLAAPGMYETLWVNYLLVSTGAGFQPSTGMSYDWVFDRFLKWCKLWDGNSKTMVVWKMISDVPSKTLLFKVQNVSFSLRWGFWGFRCLAPSKAFWATNTAEDSSPKSICPRRAKRPPYLWFIGKMLLPLGWYP